MLTIPHKCCLSFVWFKATESRENNVKKNKTKCAVALNWQMRLIVDHF
jgi:hypothetical protein